MSRNPCSLLRTFLPTVRDIFIKQKNSLIVCSKTANRHSESSPYKTKAVDKN